MQNSAETIENLARKLELVCKYDAPSVCCGVFDSFFTSGYFLQRGSLSAFGIPRA